MGCGGQTEALPLVANSSSFSTYVSGFNHLSSSFPPCTAIEAWFPERNAQTLFLLLPFWHKSYTTFLRKYVVKLFFVLWHLGSPCWYFAWFLWHFVDYFCTQCLPSSFDAYLQRVQFVTQPKYGVFYALNNWFMIPLRLLCFRPCTSVLHMHLFAAFLWSYSV